MKPLVRVAFFMLSALVFMASPVATLGSGFLFCGDCSVADIYIINEYYLLVFLSAYILTLPAFYFSTSLYTLDS